MLDDITERIPKFYGSVTVGERGQIAIPAEARRDQEIAPGAKLLAFGGPDGRAIVFVSAEYVTQFIAGISTLLSQFEQMLKANIETQE